MFFCGTCDSCGNLLSKIVNEIRIVRKVIAIDENTEEEKVSQSSNWDREVCDKCRDKIISGTNTYRRPEGRDLEIDKDVGVNTTKC
jgi:hypothetical protein